MSIKNKAPIALTIVVLLSAVTPVSAQAATFDSGGELLVGVRGLNIGEAQRTLGPIEVTRQYYDKLPSTYRVRYPKTHVIISYRRSTATNTAHYVKSIPAGAPVELVYHHEPEGTHGDYSGSPRQAGAQFVKEFNAQARVIHANSNVPVGFIAGGYQYRSAKGRGIGGYFIPPTADNYYEDRYQLEPNLMPAAKDPAVVNYRAELAKKGKRFAGFSEYARGTVSANPKDRVNVLKADNTWLRSIGAKVWVYWWEPARHSWKFNDSASITQWKRIAAQ